MRAGPIVIFHVTEQQVTEVALAEYNNVVKAFPSDRTDQPFSISILPRGARRRGSIADAYRSESADKNLAISAVPVTNEIAGSLFPTAGFRDLICDPFCGRMRCDAKPQNMSPAVPHDQQSIEQAKRDCRHDEHIHRGDAVGMIAKERPPALGRRVASPNHVLGHAGLSDVDAELEEFSMDPRRSPQRVGNAHLADKIAYLQRNCWPATPRLRFPAPIQSEAGAMPFDYGLRLNNRQRIANARAKPIEANKYQSVDGAEGLFLRSGSPQNVYLLPQRQNFRLERCPRQKQIYDHPNNEPDKISHPATASPDSRSTASQIRFATGIAGAKR